LSSSSVEVIFKTDLDSARLVRITNVRKQCFLFDAFLKLFRGGCVVGNSDDKANLSQMQLQLPTGTELGKNLS
jgi:hypothetical protein